MVQSLIDRLHDAYCRTFHRRVRQEISCEIKRGMEHRLSFCPRCWQEDETWRPVAVRYHVIDNLHGAFRETRHMSPPVKRATPGE